MSENTIDAKFEDFLSEVGLTLPQLIQHLGASNSQLFNLDDESHTRFVELYDQIECIRGKSEDNKRRKGQLLEELTTVLFTGGTQPILKERKNCRTTTNEIDVLLEWNEFARYSGINSAFPCFGDSFLCECKNYNGKVGVTYVGKFYSLLTVTKTYFGVMVSWDGITAKGKWSDSLGLTKKIALAQNTHIIAVDKYDLKKIYNKETNIFQIIHDKYIALKDDIDYTKYIEPHPAEADMV